MKKNGQFVGVNEEFIPEEEKYVDESLLGDKEKTKKTLKTIGKGYLIYVGIIVLLSLVMIGFVIFSLTKTLSFANNFKDDVVNNMNGVMENINNPQNSDTGLLDNIDTEKISGVLSGAMDNMANQMGNMDVEQFNAVFELYVGRQNKSSVERVINEVSKINNKKEKIIEIKFEDKKVTDNKEIITLISKLTEPQYFISCEYDEEGYIKTVSIDKI